MYCLEYICRQLVIKLLTLKKQIFMNIFSLSLLYSFEEIMYHFRGGFFFCFFCLKIFKIYLCIYLERDKETSGGTGRERKGESISNRPRAEHDLMTLRSALSWNQEPDAQLTSSPRSPYITFVLQSTFTPTATLHLCGDPLEFSIFHL